jgi:hypothetical protein
MVKKKQTKKVSKKKKLYCEKCGLIVTVDKACGCIDTCDLICCGQQLKEKK